MRLGGKDCSEQRLSHCTPAWATEGDLSKKKTKKRKKKKETKILKLVYYVMQICK